MIFFIFTLFCTAAFSSFVTYIVWNWYNLLNTKIESFFKIGIENHRLFQNEMEILHKRMNQLELIILSKHGKEQQKNKKDK